MVKTRKTGSMKSLGVAALITASTLLGCQGNKQQQSTEKTTKDTISVLQDSPTPLVEELVPDTFDFSAWLANKDATQDTTKSTIQDDSKKNDSTKNDSTENDSIEVVSYTTPTITYNIKDLRKNNDALVTNSKHHTLLYLLGEQDVNTIMQQYNPTLSEKKGEDFDWKWTKFTGLDSITVPMIFPSVRDFFNEDLRDFLQDKPSLQTVMQDFFQTHPSAAKKFKDSATCIIQTKLPNDKMGIAYYENGRLLLAGPASIGNGKWYKNPTPIPGEGEKFHARSPQGSFFIINKVAQKRNRQGDNMPYYMEFNAYTKKGNLRGLGIHGGQLVSGDPKSHGCSRFVHALTKPLFEKVKRTKDIENPGTPVFASREPYEKELDSVAYNKTRKKPKQKIE